MSNARQKQVYDHFNGQQYRVNQLVSESLSALKYINNQLAIIDTQLRAIPSNPFQLEVFNCGYKSPLDEIEEDNNGVKNTASSDGCMGCPHIRWVKYYNPQIRDPMNPSNWSGKRIKSPLMYKKMPKGVRELAEKAKAYLDKRERLIKRLRELNVSITWLDKNGVAVFEE